VLQQAAQGQRQAVIKGCTSEQKAIASVAAKIAAGGLTDHIMVTSCQVLLQLLTDLTT